VDSTSSQQQQQQQVAPDNNETAHLHCTFVGHPVQIDWLKDGSPIDVIGPEAGHKYSFTTYMMEDEGLIRAQLSVNVVTVSDYGRYTCAGQNKYGRVAGDVWLTGRLLTEYYTLPQMFL